MMTCCRLLRNDVLAELPFDRVLAIGYYDGPTDGFTKCAVCGSSYSFRMLAWDDEQDFRVLAFVPLNLGLDQIAKRLGFERQYEDGFPVVLIAPLASGARTVGEVEKEFGIERRDDRAEGGTGENPFYVTVINGWPGQSSIWRIVSSRDFETVDDWFKFLGLLG